jgi:hypothetical protein
VSDSLLRLAVEATVSTFLFIESVAGAVVSVLVMASVTEVESFSDFDPPLPHDESEPTKIAPEMTNNVFISEDFTYALKFSCQPVHADVQYEGEIISTKSQL